MFASVYIDCVLRNFEARQGSSFINEIPFPKLMMVKVSAIVWYIYRKRRPNNLAFSENEKSIYA
jgi:hypothetical protein